MKKKHPLKNLSLWFFVCIPIVLHFVFLSKFSLNFPFEDDHRVFMDFFYNYLNADDFKDRILILLTPDNESRPFLIRLSLLIPLSIFKTIDFKSILYFVNIYTFLLLWIFIRKYRESPIFLVLISFLLLSHCSWEMFFRNDVASYQLATVSLSILLFYLISLPIGLQNILIGILFYFCLLVVPFGSALGFVTVFLIMFYAFFRKIYFHRFVILCLLVFQVVVYIISDTGDGNNISPFDNLFKYNYQLIWAYFIALGGQFRFIYNDLGYTISGCLGVLTLIFSTYFLLKNWDSKAYDFEKLIYVFGAGSLSLIVISRFNYWIIGYDSVLGARYKIYGILVFLVGMSFVFRMKIEPRVKWAIVGVFIVFYVGWLLKSSDYLNLKNETQMMDAYNLENGIVRNEKQNTTFEADFKYQYLKQNGYFNANDLYLKVLSKIKNGIVVLPEKAVLSQVDFDPAFESDWGGKEEKLYKIVVTGHFPMSSNYFIRIIDINNKTMLLNGQRKPLSIIKKVVENDKEIDFLSKEFELGHYKLEKPLKCDVICFNPRYKLK